MQDFIEKWNSDPRYKTKIKLTLYTLFVVFVAIFAVSGNNNIQNNEDNNLLPDENNLNSINNQNSTNENNNIQNNNGNNGNGHLGTRHTLLDKETIYHLVQRAVTTDDHNSAITVIYGLYGEFSNVILMLREDQLIRNVVLADKFGNEWQVLQSATKTGYGIYDDVPRLRYISMRIHCFTF